jgi:hypothetical protein
MECEGGHRYIFDHNQRGVKGETVQAALANNQAASSLSSFSRTVSLCRSNCPRRHSIDLRHDA